MHAESLAGHALSWLLTYGLHSTLLLCLAWLASTRLAADAQRARELLWRAALLGGLFTASAQVAIGHEPWLGRFALAPSVAAQPEQQRPSLQGEAPSQASVQPPDLALSRADEDSLPRTDESAALAGSASAGAPASGADFEPAPRGPSSGGSPARLALGAGGLQLELGFPQGGFAGETAVQTSAPAARAPLSLRSTQQNAQARTPPARFGWAQALLALWLVGALIGLARLAFALRALHEGLAERFALEAGPLARTLAELRREAGLRRHVRLSCAPGLAAPLALGWLRPEICVPLRAATDLTPEQQRGMLAHELAHLVRRDPLWLLACRALEGLLFFQPLNRLARRELQATAEYLCDDWAAARSGGGLALASCLAEVAGWFAHGSAPRTPALAAGMASRPSALSARIERLLASRSCARSTRWSAPAIALLLAGVALAAPGAGAKPASGAPQPEGERAQEAVEAQARELATQPEADAASELAAVDPEHEAGLDAHLEATAETTAEIAAEDEAASAADELALALEGALQSTERSPIALDERAIAAWLARNNAMPAEGSALQPHALAPRLAPSLTALDAEIAGLERELAEAARLAERRGLAPALRTRLRAVERALDVLHERRAQLDELLARLDAPSPAPSAD